MNISWFVYFQEINDKRRDAKLAFEAWKDTKKDPLIRKKKEEKKKKAEKEEEENEKLMKKSDAKKVSCLIIGTLN